MRLPRDFNRYEEFEVYVSGVRQRRDLDYEIEGRHLVFSRRLRSNRISRWRWFLGAWGIGTYRQDDVVDLRYDVDGEMRLAHALQTLDEER